MSQDVLSLLSQKGAVAGQFMQPQAPLLEAVTSGDLAGVHQLLLAGADPLQKHVRGMYPLLGSILCGNTAITAYILANGVELKDCGLECLKAAARKGLMNEIRLLLGYKVEFSDAASIECLGAASTYLKAYEIRKKDYEAFAEAIKADDPGGLRALIHKQPLPYWDTLVREFKQFEKTQNVLEAVLKQRSTKCISYLLTEEKSSTNSFSLSKALWFLAIDRNDADSQELLSKYVNALVQAGASATFAQDNEGTALSVAIGASNFLIVQPLLSQGANPNTSVSGGENPMQLAAKYRQAEVLGWLLDDTRADCNLADASGVYPLLISAHFGDLDCLEILLKHGALTYQAQYPERVPLVSAARFASYDCVKLLLKYGADRSRTDKWGKTALDYAREIPGADELVALLQGP